ncbi:hypothetical protein HMPREF1624_04441 [Sporothrix schenckii ATCC 58251]|uniref:MARVEL domain-containing protein n=1 Tax=Sporothrix schenckii (strain ATCC 58251 / de Perez 2211183) TaxID=1391915 RepID=U7PUD9_SPOS1|nr:hypothetical protein HMPREF1624_04441 [Sporothrix schenckii ATCC 58251]
MFGIGGDSAARPVGREHVPVYPAYFLYLRFAQLLVTVIVLGLDAYGLSVLSFSGDELMIFTVIASLIVCIYVLVATLAAPAAYNYWAVLSLDILLVIFWLASFALLASQVAPFMGNQTYCAYGYCYHYGLEGQSLVYAQCLAAAAGLGGLNFLFYIATTVINGLALHVHRGHGLHSVAGQPATSPAGPAHLDAEKAAAAAGAASGVPAGNVVPLQQANPAVYYYQPPVAAPVAAAPIDPNAQYYAVQQQQQAGAVVSAPTPSMGA